MDHPYVVLPVLGAIVLLVAAISVVSSFHPPGHGYAKERREWAASRILCCGAGCLAVFAAVEAVRGG